MPLGTPTYISPTGERARLTADHVSGPGCPLWWSVALVRENGDVRRVAGQPPILWHQTREQRRIAYGQRLANLKGEGWRKE